MINAQNKYLVFASVGDQSKHRDFWLSSREKKLFDLAICYYGTGIESHQNDAEYYCIRQGFKLPNFYHTIDEGVWKRYRYILLLDDDIEIDTIGLNTFFEICDQYNILLAQPAYTTESVTSHPFLTVMSGHILRYVNFVEIGLMCFSTDSLARCIHTFPDAATGYGADMLYPQLLSDTGKRPVELLKQHFAVVDATPARHPARSGPSDQERLVAKADHPNLASAFYEKHVDAKSYNRWITPEMYYGADVKGRKKPTDMAPREWSDRDRPVLLPHFRVADGQLWFLSRTPLYNVSSSSAKLLDQLDGSRTLAEIADNCNNVDQPMAAIRQRRMAVALPAKAAQTSKKHETWCVISPHPDDAALSVGGTLILRQEFVHIHLVTLAMKSFYAEIPALSGRVEEVSEIRLLEERLYARFVDGTLIPSDLKDNQLRGENVVSRSSVTTFREEIHRLCAPLYPDVIIAPLGVHHVDHITVAQAVLELATEWKEDWPNLKIWFYEDLPYSALNYLELMHRLRDHQQNGIDLRAIQIDIASVWQRKIEGLSIYRSQRLDRWIDHLEVYAKLCGLENVDYEGGFRERLWELRSISGNVGQMSVMPDLG